MAALRWSGFTAQASHSAAAHGPDPSLKEERVRRRSPPAGQVLDQRALTAAGRPESTKRGSPSGPGGQIENLRISFSDTRW